MPIIYLKDGIINYFVINRFSRVKALNTLDQLWD